MTEETPETRQLVVVVQRLHDDETSTFHFDVEVDPHEDSDVEDCEAANKALEAAVEQGHVYQDDHVKVLVGDTEEPAMSLVYDLVLDRYMLLALHITCDHAEQQDQDDEDDVLEDEEEPQAKGDPAAPVLAPIVCAGLVTGIVYMLFRLFR